MMLIEYLVRPYRHKFSGRLVLPVENVLLQHVGPCSVITLTDRQRRHALWLRHATEHGCVMDRCEVSGSLWDAMHPDDKIVLA